jgi:4-aminobutyrate aminotransferase-like enzyme
MYESLRRGLSFKVGGGTTLVLFPPLNTDQPTLELAAEILAASIESTA